MITKETIAVLIDGRHVAVPSFVGGVVTLTYKDANCTPQILARGSGDTQWFSTEAGGFIDIDVVPLSTPRTVYGVAVDMQNGGTACHLFTSKVERDLFLLETLTPEPEKYVDLVKEKGFFCDEVQRAGWDDPLTTYATEEVTV